MFVLPHQPVGQPWTTEWFERALAIHIPAGYKRCAKPYCLVVFQKTNGHRCCGKHRGKTVNL